MEPDSRAEGPRLDPGVVATLWVRHARELRDFLQGVLRNADLAEEALQSTFVKAIEAGSTSEETTRKGWLFRVAYHEAMQLCRRRQIDLRAVRRSAWRSVSEDGNADTALVRQEERREVEAALGELPPEYQIVVRMRIHENLTFAEIAERTGTPLGTVLTRMRASLTKLRSRLKGRSSE
jgi:RNA polymerase sigma-70 factor (ECF subfamily)